MESATTSLLDIFSHANKDFNSYIKSNINVSLTEEELIDLEAL